jgi:hypothetical protein
MSTQKEGRRPQGEMQHNFALAARACEGQRVAEGVKYEGTMRAFEVQACGDQQDYTQA